MDQHSGGCQDGGQLLDRSPLSRRVIKDMLHVIGDVERFGGWQDDLAGVLALDLWRRMLNVRQARTLLELGRLSRRRFRWFGTNGFSVRL